MRFSAFLPALPADQLLDVATAADESGWDSVGLVESVFYPETVSAKYPHAAEGRFWPPETPFVDPLVAIPAMAAVTERLGFFVGVLKAPIRQPLLIAKSLGSIAAMFPGRIALGMGTSWIPEEFKWLGEDWASRGARLDEIIEIVRRCLSPGWAEFHGTYYDFDRLMMMPAPSGPVPLYVGGHAPPALRRAARLGDGWISVDADTEQLQATIPKLLAERAAHDRAGQPFEIIAICYGRPSIDAVRRYEDLGVTRLAIVPYGQDDADAGRKGDAFRRYADDVIGRMNG